MVMITNKWMQLLSLIRGLNDVDHHESIGVQSSHLHLSPSVTQLPGGDSERPNMNSDSDSEKDYRVEQMYSSSQLPSEEQKQESKDDEHNVFVDGDTLARRRR